MQKPAFPLLLVLLALSLLSACAAQDAEVSSVVASPSPTSSLSQTPTAASIPPPLPNPTAKAAEFSLQQALKTLRTLNEQNTAYKSQPGWLHTHTESTDLYYQYYLDHPESMNDKRVLEFFKIKPPHLFEETWPELAGDGTLTGNSLYITYDQDQVPLFASADRVDEQAIRVKVFLNPDGSIAERIPTETTDVPVPSLPVSRLSSYLADASAHWTLVHVEEEEEWLDERRVFRLSVQDETAAPLDLDYFPERVSGFISTHRVDLEHGECLSFTEEAVGLSGQTYLTREVRTHLFELIRELPPNVAARYQAILDLALPDQQGAIDKPSSGLPG